MSVLKNNTLIIYPLKIPLQRALTLFKPIETPTEALQRSIFNQKD